MCTFEYSELKISLIVMSVIEVDEDESEAKGTI
jgi:hypothetical protein